MSLNPLRPAEFFRTPWAGAGEWRPRPWVRWAAGPASFRFESSATWLTDEVWLVHDTTSWDDGRVERRDGTARLVAPDRIRLSYDDMPGGTELRLREDGFTFDPYAMLVAVPLVPVAVVLQARDECRWDGSARELTDTIDLSVLGLPLGRQQMRLHPE